ncbi:hypothetical protein QEN19_002845 [Hanseniaspora menglaensis]
MKVQETVQTLSMIAMLSLIPPFCWHLKTKNMPALTLIVWIFLYNLKTFVDATVWSKDIIGLMTGWDGKGWCDLMIYIDVGAYVAVPCCICRISQQLTTIIKAEKILPDKTKITFILKDLAIVNSVPFVCMVMSYFIQINRYGLMSYNGCQPFFSATWVTLVLYSVWPFLVSTVGFFLSFRLLYIFYKKKKDAKDILHCTDSGLTLSRFSRFIFFCLLIIFIMFPVSVYNFIDTWQKISGKYNYKKYHKNGAWWNIPKISTSKPFYSVWIYMTMSYCSFFIFGTSSDALNMYITVIKKLGFKDLIESWEQQKQEKKQSKLNKLFMNKSLAEQENFSLYSKIETPINITALDSALLENSDYNFFEDDEFEYVNILKKKLEQEQFTIEELNKFEIDYNGVPNSNFQYQCLATESFTDSRRFHKLNLLNHIKAVSDHSDKKTVTTGLKEDNGSEMFFQYEILKKD